MCIHGDPYLGAKTEKGPSQIGLGTSTLQNCQGHDKQGKTEKLWQTREDEDKVMYIAILE
jgi:hypothetical protein